ncbi:uncharacterized protein YdeI (YjbR/CyaY-like superfamily) [Kribbella amoyensis]|uniref:Uncharacterized protein YdeI (YjbR/CyaY-like superfamily) n=2 Tax=Kribbella amoyensis TaxID=996641 RepID=A0A561BJW1_9ACTN|nr:uncharacterized protein YdeI (YjbR/CyaY-like superfamily) [Kribbella amoyensis]
MTAMTDEQAVLLGSVAEWREWLAANGGTERALWLVVHRKGAEEPGVDYVAAVEQALCFGWVDSKTVKRDAGTTYQCFTPRNPRSTWSQVNRDRVERLVAAGLMTAPGQAVVDEAKRTGSWDILAEAQNLIVPADLRSELDGTPEAAAHFAAFPKSAKRAILEWIALAKRPETRAARIEQTVTQAAANQRAR